MSVRIPSLSITVFVLVGVFVSACSAGQPTVVQKLDERSAVTVTYGATPMVMSVDESYGRSNERRYVQIGSFEINRMGNRTYYLWLGISGLDESRMTSGSAAAFESVELLLDNQSLNLNVVGWSPGSVGVGEPVYRKLYATSIEAYYPITLEQIQLLANSTMPKIRTAGTEPVEYVPWYQQAAFKKGLEEFLVMVN